MISACTGSKLPLVTLWRCGEEEEGTVTSCWGLWDGPSWACGSSWAGKHRPVVTVGGEEKGSFCLQARGRR